MNQTNQQFPTALALVANSLLLLLIVSSVANCFSSPQAQGSMLAARRAADDSRPLSRVLYLNQAASQETPVVMGKFRAPAPERIHKQRIGRPNGMGSHTMSASFRVADVDSAQPEKIVHGIGSLSSLSNGAERKQAANQRTVSAKIMVSDEGLNYPPSKLSADIYGNVAEIVTAPPEAVDNDFLLPQNTAIYGTRRGN